MTDTFCHQVQQGKFGATRLDFSLTDVYDSMQLMPYKTHVFICTNSPDNPEKCGSRGAEKFRRGIKEKCQSRYNANEVRINSSGCLGHCEKGIAAVIYPKGDWHFCLTDKDEEKILDAVKSSMDSEKHK